MRRAFTLVELVVVLIIIALASLLAAPAIRSLIFSSQQARAVKTFGSLLITTQSAARSHFTRAALRVERGFEVDGQGQMIKDGLGNPRWLDRQQMRVLVFGHRRAESGIPGEERSFRQLAHTGPTALPNSVWLAPDYALSPEFERKDLWQPSGTGTVPVNTLETFYVVFDRQGKLVRLPPDKTVYLDETQGNALAGHPCSSARAAIAYDRRSLDPQGDDLQVLANGVPLYINRYSGCAISSGP